MATRTKKTAAANTATDDTSAGGVTASGAKIMPVPEIKKTMGKRELIDRVVEASGIKKKAAKPVIEAMLKELGDALSRGETLNLQPFGKGIVKTRKSFENADVLEVRLRRSRQSLSGATMEDVAEAESADQEPLAEAAE